MFKKTDNLVRGGVSYTQYKFLSSVLSIIGILYSKSCFKTFFSWVHWRRRQWGSFRQRSAVKLGGSEQNTDSKALVVLLSSLHFLPIFTLSEVNFAVMDFTHFQLTSDPNDGQKWSELCMDAIILMHYVMFCRFFARISSKNAPKHLEPFDPFRSVVGISRHS